jgi:molybdate transport system substrate-binding protein
MAPKPVKAALALLIAASIGACGKPRDADADPAREIVIAAASSLRELLTTAAPAFEAEHPGVKLRFSFEASSTLARQIQEGAGFDVFLSADMDTVDRVRKEVDPESITPFLSNQLALMVRAGLADAPKTPQDLVRLPGKIALAGPEVPAGKYARAYLRKAGLLDVLAPRVVNAESVRAALAFVESGAADYAWVYRSEATVARNAHIAWIATGADDPGIVYVAAVISGSASPVARDYVRWLRTDHFLTDAERLGFRRPTP